MSGTESGGSIKVKARRTRTGCLTCRTRKIKCDENPDRCDNCQRAGLACEWAPLKHIVPLRQLNDGPTTHITPVISTRVRLPACLECRNARTKCDHERPSCARCRQNSLTCEYDFNDSPRITIPASTSEHPRSPVASDNPTRETSSEARLLKRARSTSPANATYEQIRVSSTTEQRQHVHSIPRSTLDPHVKAYFSYIYPVQGNAFIHQATLRRKIAEHRAPRKLLLALCAVSNRFLPPQTSSSTDSLPHRNPVQARDWANEAKTLCVVEDDLSPDTVATALLLAKHDVYMAKYTAAWIMSSIAIRVAMALNLHKEVGEDMLWSERETRRRLFWACYCIDRMMSSGFSDLVLIQPQVIHLRLPCEEQQFLLGIPCSTPFLQLENDDADGSLFANGGEDQNVGMFGRFVQLTNLRYMILKCTRSPPTIYSPTPHWHPQSPFQKCRQQMTNWHQSLPAQFQLNAETIYARHTQNELPALVMLHLWYHQSMSDLLRVTMPGFPESLDPAYLALAPGNWVHDTQYSCMSHADAIGRLLHQVDEHVGKDTFVFMDPALPICVYESIRLQVQRVFLQREQHLPDKVKEFDEASRYKMSWLEQMPKAFRTATFMLKEISKMLRRHKLWTGAESQSAGEDSGSHTPVHPWSKRVYEGTHRDSVQAVDVDGSSRTNLNLFTSNPAAQPLMTELPGVMTFSDQSEDAGDLFSGFQAGIPALDGMDPLGFAQFFDQWTASESSDLFPHPQVVQNTEQNSSLMGW